MTSQFSANNYVPKPSQLPQILQQASTGGMLRNRFFTDVDQTIGADTIPRCAAVLRVLADHIAEADLLEGVPCTGSALQYTRTLLKAGEGYSILAIVWLPGQMSPVHGHKAWCALGVHQGELVETYSKASLSEKTGEDELRVTGCRQLAAGAVSGSDPDPNHYHRVANLGVIPAVSIHIYGTGFDRLGTDLNQPWPS